MSKEKYVYDNVEVLRVIDGDTLLLLFSLGFDLYKTAKVRLYGINAPETKAEEREQGLRSKSYVQELLPIGTNVKAEILGQDKYGRWLAVVHKDDMVINQHLVQHGYAKEYML